MLSSNRILRCFSASTDQYATPSAPAPCDKPSFEPGFNNGALAALRGSSRARVACDGRPRSALPTRPDNANPMTVAHRVRDAGFSDRDLAVAMRKILVESGVLTKRDLAKLLHSPSEETVRGKLGTDLTAAERAFGTYWRLLGAWLSERGGDIEALSGRNFAGRSGVQPDISTRAIYNDAFRDVRVHLERDGFNVVKAVANHLRLAKLFS